MTTDETPSGDIAGGEAAEARTFLVFAQNPAPEYGGPVMTPELAARYAAETGNTTGQPYGDAYAVTIPGDIDNAERVAAMTVMQHIGRLTKLAVVDAVLFDPSASLFPDAVSRPLLNP